MNIGEVVKGIFEFLFEDAISTLVEPLLNFVTIVALSPETLAQITFIDPLFGVMQKIGAAILILVTTWQGFKSMGIGLGLEADEPQKIAVKALIAGFLMYGIKDIMILMITICSDFVNLIMNSMSLVSGDVGLTDIITKFLFFHVDDLIYTILGVVLVFKFMGLTFKMFKRLVMCALLIICSPLAVATMVAKPTEGFWQGFIKLFVGNIVIQIVQALTVVGCIASMSMGIESGNGPSMNGFFSIMLTIALLSITNQLEDIVKDLSISVGMNRDMQGALGKVQSAAYAATTVQSMTKFIKV